MNKEIFVQNVKKYCILKGVKPTVACRESGVGKSFINNIESRGQIPSVEKVQMLANYLGCTTSDLLGENKIPVYQASFETQPQDTFNKLFDAAVVGADLMLQTLKLHIKPHVNSFDEPVDELLTIQLNAEVFSYSDEVIDKPQMNEKEKVLFDWLRYLEPNYLKAFKELLELTNEGANQVIALICALEQLNEEGQEKLVDYASDLVASRRYIKTDPSGMGQKEA